jgi:hypothetical protein
VLARPEGFEPPTPRFVVWCSIQLSYGRVGNCFQCFGRPVKRSRICPGQRRCTGATRVYLGITSAKGNRRDAGASAPLGADAPPLGGAPGLSLRQGGFWRAVPGVSSVGMQDARGGGRGRLRQEWLGARAQASRARSSFSRSRLKSFGALRAVKPTMPKVSMPASPTDLSDRDHFRVHADSDRDELFISKPLLGRVSQKWSIQLSRGINAVDGAFAGVVILSIDPWYLASFYESIDVKSNGMVLLAGLDGIVCARVANGERSVGQSLLGSALFQRVAEGDSGSFETFGQDDGIVRLASYRRVNGYPLVVSDRIGHVTLRLRHVAQGAMRFHVGDAVVAIGGERLGGADLVGHDALDFGGGKWNPAAAETPQVGQARMCAHRDAALFGSVEGLRHDLRIAGVKAAGDVRRGDDGQHGLVVAALVGAETFTEIGIEIDSRHRRLR